MVMSLQLNAHYDSVRLFRELRNIIVSERFLDIISILTCILLLFYENVIVNLPLIFIVILSFNYN